MIPRLDDWEAEKNPHCAIMQEDGTGEEWCPVTRLVLVRIGEASGLGCLP